MYAYIHIYIYICMHVCIYTYICMHIYIYTYTYVCIYTAYICIHTVLLGFMHLWKETSKHIYICVCIYRVDYFSMF